MSTMRTARPPRRRGTGPEDDEQRAGGHVAATVPQQDGDTSDLAELVAAAQRYIAQIGDLARRDEENFWRGWRAAADVFFDHGIEVGRQQLGNEILAEEERLGKHISAIGRLPIFADLEARRYPGYSPERLRELRAWCPA